MVKLIRKHEDREYIQEKFAVQQYADRLKRLFTISEPKAHLPLGGGSGEQ